jgi:hypothetical protein
MERWLSEAAILKSNGDDRGATLLTQHAAELFAEVQEWEAEALRIHDAALESGYSEDRLRKLVGEGRIPNAGRRGKPRVKRADLPRKANSRKSAIAVHEPREHTDDALFLDIVHTKHGSA